jgi:hypothetical protein
VREAVQNGGPLPSLHAGDPQAKVQAAIQYRLLPKVDPEKARQVMRDKIEVVRRNIRTAEQLPNTLTRPMPVRDPRLADDDTGTVRQPPPPLSVKVQKAEPRNGRVWNGQEIPRRGRGPHWVEGAQASSKRQAVPPDPAIPLIGRSRLR